MGYLKKIFSSLFPSYRIDEFFLASLLILLSSFHYFSRNYFFAYFIFIIAIMSTIFSFLLIAKKIEAKDDYSRGINFVMIIFCVYASFLYFYDKLILNYNSVESLNIADYFLIFYAIINIIRSVYVFSLLYSILYSVSIYASSPNSMETVANNLTVLLPTNKILPKNYLYLIIIIVILLYYFFNKNSHNISLAHSFFGGLFLLYIVNSLKIKNSPIIKD